MSGTNDKKNGDKALSDAIRNRIDTDLNRRSLSRIPSFKPVAELPERLRDLLGELDRAEDRQRRGAAGGQMAWSYQAAPRQHS